MPSEFVENTQHITALALENLKPSNPLDESQPQDVVSTLSSQPKPTFISYTRNELLFLSESPLVKPPSGLPSLKDWFGEWTEQQASLSKRGDPDGGMHTRERRAHRKDDDDAELGAKPSFRSSIGATQPSQMGNFRHQSSRMPSISDRVDRDHDQGHERLRNLSEKFDRERLALASRREVTSRPSGTTMNRSNGAKSERKENSSQKDRERETGKRKSELNDDWRRVLRDESTDSKTNLSSETGRDDSQERLQTLEGSRWASGKHRGESPTDVVADVAGQLKKTQLDDRAIDFAGDASSTSDSRRPDKTSRRRRQPSPGRNHQDLEGWEAEKPLRDKERARTREGNLKSAIGQGRKGHVEDEREPAWMQTYDPEKDGKLAGALGGDPSNGQLDSIQAWKQELKAKEKEQQISDSSTDGNLGNTSTETPLTNDTVASNEGTNRGPIDEIAMFKMMMQREQLKGEEEQNVPFALSGTTVGWPGGQVANTFQTSEVQPSLQFAKDSSDSTLHRPQSDYEPPRQSRILSYGNPSISNGESLLQFGRHAPLDEPHFVAPDLNSTNQMLTTESITQMNPSPTIDVSQTILHSLQQAGPGTGHRPHNNHLFQQQSELYRSSGVPDSRIPTSLYISGPNSSIPDSLVSPTAGASVRGASRFAKFFEQKTRDGASPVSSSSQSHIPPPHNGPSEYPHMLNQLGGAGADSEAFQSMLAMLHNSSRNVMSSEFFQRPGPQSGAPMGFNKGGAQPMRTGAGQPYSETTPLPMDSRFSPDGLVPGLKPARARPTHFDLQENIRSSDSGTQGFSRNFIGGQGLEALGQHQYSRTHSPSGGRIPQFPPNAGLGGTPLSMHAPQNRLPPGLANLGARPPHDPSQVMHGSMSMGANVHQQMQPREFGMVNKTVGNAYRRSPQPMQHIGSQGHYNPGMTANEEMIHYGTEMRSTAGSLGTFGQGQHNRSTIVSNQQGHGYRNQPQEGQMYQLLSQHGGHQVPSSQVMSSHYPTSQVAETRAQNELMALLLRGGLPENR